MKSMGDVSVLCRVAETFVAGKPLGATVMDVRFRGQDITRAEMETATRRN